MKPKSNKTNKQGFLLRSSWRLMSVLKVLSPFLLSVQVIILLAIAGKGMLIKASHFTPLFIILGVFFVATVFAVINWHFFDKDK